MTAEQTANRDDDGIPTAWVVWIDDNMGYGAPNWEIDNPGDHPEEPLHAALEHAREVLSKGYPTAIRPVGSPPSSADAAPPILSDAPMYPAKRTPRITGNKSVLVYGPQGSGKTLHAEELRQHFGLAAVLDDWLPGSPWPIKDHLVLSHEPAPADMRRAIPIQSALAMLRNNAPGYPF